MNFCCIDGTEDKGNLGANALLGISLAVAKARASLMAKRIVSRIV